MEHQLSIFSATVIDLPTDFIGRGEVKGFLFRQIKHRHNAYIYEVSDTSGGKWYEVFIARIDTRFAKIAYPKSNAFGIRAWTIKTHEKALERFKQISQDECVIINPVNP